MSLDIAICGHFVFAIGWACFCDESVLFGVKRLLLQLLHFDFDFFLEWGILHDWSFGLFVGFGRIQWLLDLRQFLLAEGLLLSNELVKVIGGRNTALLVCLERNGTLGFVSSGEIPWLVNLGVFGSGLKLGSSDTSRGPTPVSWPH